jgi:DNA-binding transcriptional LysR family regulator
MNLNELRTFLAIVESGSLIRASEVLNVTQSTVTARLHTLEQEMGEKLIHRSKSGATMSAAGMRLHRYADTMVDLWRQAKHETSLPTGMSGICNLACEADLWPALGEVFFRRLKAHQPDMAVSVWLGNQSDITGWLNDGKCDLAFTYQAATTQRQERIDLPRDRLVLVSTNPDSPLKFDPGYVFVEAGEAFGRDHAAAYADANTARISFGNAALGLEHLLNSGGSAYLPQRMIKRHVTAGTLHFLANAPVFERSKYVIYNRAAPENWPWFDDFEELLT